MKWVLVPMAITIRWSEYPYLGVNLSHTASCRQQKATYSLILIAKADLRIFLYVRKFSSFSWFVSSGGLGSDRINREKNHLNLVYVFLDMNVTLCIELSKILLLLLLLLYEYYYFYYLFYFLWEKKQLVFSKSLDVVCDILMKRCSCDVGTIRYVLVWARQWNM